MPNKLIIILPEFYTMLGMNILGLILLFILAKHIISWLGLPSFLQTAARISLILAVVLLVGLSFKNH